MYVGDFSPDVRPVPALRARVLDRAGRLAEALGWARERGLSAEDDLSYLREFEHITLARVLLARYAAERADGSLDEATGLLERLLRAAEEGGRTGSVIEILVVQALAHQARGDIPAALAPLDRALTLAEPEGYVRVFVDEGPPMASLLRAAAKQGDRRELRPSTPGRRRPDRGPQRRQPGPDRAAERAGARRASAARTDLDGPDIARELIVSLNTVRTHTKNIYAKLGVNNRRAAVRRAEELDLLSRTRCQRPNLTIWTASSTRVRARRTSDSALAAVISATPYSTSPFAESSSRSAFSAVGGFGRLPSGLLQFLRSRRVVLALARRAGEHGDDCVLGADARVDRVAGSGGVTFGRRGCRRRRRGTPRPS